MEKKTLLTVDIKSSDFNETKTIINTLKEIESFTRNKPEFKTINEFARKAFEKKENFNEKH